MPRNKANNQYYGKYTECCVVANLNGEDVVYNENYDKFTEKEKINMFNDGRIIAEYLGDHTATYCGNHTGTAAGDFILDNGEVVELKCVGSNSSGTYWNTSLHYFEKFGFNIHNYMEEFKLYDALEKCFGDQFSISRKKASPVNKDISSFIRDNYKDDYKTYILPVDEEMRIQLTSDICDFFEKNPDKVYEFLNDSVQKGPKGKPDRYIIYDYNRQTITEVDLDNLLDGNVEIIKNDKGFRIGNLRFAIAWGNGSGLNNPVLRAYIVR